MRSKVLAMYADTIANWLSGGKLINRDNIASSSLKTVYNKIMTKQYVTKVWCILGLPVNYDHNLSEGIRREMFKACPTVRTVIHTYNTPVSVQINSRIFTQYMAKASSAFDDYATVFAQLRDDEKLTGKMDFNPETGRRIWVNRKELLRIKERRDSYTYVYKRCSAGKIFTETYFFIQASAPTQREIEQYTKRLGSILQAEEIAFAEVRGGLPDYLHNFGPASYYTSGVKRCNTMLMSEENLAALMPYRAKGLVGTNGLLLGLEWQSKLPEYFNPFESSDGQVVLVAGKTGCGKTYVCFNIAQNAVGYGIHGSAIDIKGNEWNKLGKFIDLKEISLDGENQRFVNTLRLDDLGCTSKNCRDMYNNAITGTVILLSLMVQLQPSEGNTADLNTILEKAVSKLYSQSGVNPDNPDTFIRTKDLKYSDVISVVTDLKNTNIYNESQIRICDLIIFRCSMYFMSEGRYSNAFSNELTLADIINTPFVVYSFNKNANGEMSALDSIKVFMVQFLDSKKHEVRKAAGLHTIAFYEEIQRCVSSDVMMQYITSRVTGSRSSNVTVFLLMNAISAFYESNLAQIKSNITTKIIGLMNDDDIQTLVDHFECGPIEHYLHLINNKESSSYYHNCFAMLYDVGGRVGKSIFKTILPAYMWEAFNTRDRLSL